MRWAYGFFGKKKILLLIGLALIAVNAVLEILQVAAQKTVLDGIIRLVEWQQVLGGLTVLAISYFGTSILFFVIGMIFHRVFFYWREQVIGRLYEILQNISIHCFERERISGLTILFSEVEQIGDDLFGLPYKLADFFKFIIMSIIILRINVNVFFLLMIINLVMVYLVGHMGNVVKTASKDEIKESHHILICIEEGVAGVREVATYQYEDSFLKKYDKLFERFYKASNQVMDFKNQILIISTLLKWSGVFVAILFTWNSVKSGNISLGTFFILYQYVNQFSDLYQKICNYWFDIHKLNARLGKIMEKWNDLEANHFSDGTIVIDNITKLEFRNVCFSYNGKDQILDEHSFNIDIGEKNAIVGVSGSGKSTIIELLMKNYDINQGACYVNGDINLNDVFLKSWLNKVKIVYQDCYIFNDTVRNNILLGKGGISDEKILQICQDLMLGDLISELPGGLSGKLGERGMTISGGQRQRLAMARALICNAEILILDEATSALDEQTEAVVQHSIDACYTGKTMVIVAHRLSTIRNASNIIRL